MYSLDTKQFFSIATIPSPLPNEKLVFGMTFLACCLLPLPSSFRHSSIIMRGRVPDRIMQAPGHGAQRVTVVRTYCYIPRSAMVPFSPCHRLKILQKYTVEIQRGEDQGPRRKTAIVSFLIYRSVRHDVMLRRRTALSYRSTWCRTSPCARWRRPRSRGRPCAPPDTAAS